MSSRVRLSSRSLLQVHPPLRGWVFLAQRREIVVPYEFRTPFVEEYIESNHPLFRLYKIRKGVTVVYDNDEFYEVEYPLEDDLVNVSAYWLGGHVYTVDDSMAARLSAAGYDDCLTEI